jgi:hypothetical protein
VHFPDFVKFFFLASCKGTIQAYATYAISNSKNQALVFHYSKGKKKGSYKKKKYLAQGGETPSSGQTLSKPQQKTKSGESSSQTKKKNSDEICIFCDGPWHQKSKCWKKLEALNESMYQHKIYVSKPYSIGKRHALSDYALYAFSSNWIFD